MSNHNIMVIRIDHRLNASNTLQKVLTEFGCNIKTRLGLHEAGDVCANDGLVILQLVGEQSDLDKFCDALNKLEGVKAKLINI